MIFYASLWKLKEAMIFHIIFFVKSLTFVPFHSIAMHYWHFVISYHDKWNFSVCCCTILPLGDIGKYFTIIKWKVICQILQILNMLKYIISPILIIEREINVQSEMSIFYSLSVVSFCINRMISLVKWHHFLKTD